jgi:hypothetical protein
MPVIKVWCLPPGQTEDDLRRLHQRIVAAVVSVKELALKDETQMTCLFPPDQMVYGLGAEIIVEVTGLFAHPNRAWLVKQDMARALGIALKILYPAAKVECFVTTFNQHQEGFWTSEEDQ